METVLILSYACAGITAIFTIVGGFVLIKGLNKLKEDGIVEENKEEQ